MSWSKSFSSLKDFNEASCPDDIDEEQWDAAVAAAKAIVKSGAVKEAKAENGHTKHEANKEQTAQARLSINIYGHAGSGSPSSVGCTVSEI